jgi:hypothetical protein
VATPPEQIPVEEAPVAEPTAPPTEGSPGESPPGPKAMLTLPGPELPAGMGAPSGQPPYLGFLQMFKREYGDAPKEVMATAEHIWEAFDRYMSKPDGGGWHELAQTFSYPEFLHDVVLAVAVRHGGEQVPELEPEETPEVESGPTG